MKTAVQHLYNNYLSHQKINFFNPFVYSLRDIKKTIFVSKKNCGKSQFNSGKNCSCKGIVLFRDNAIKVTRDFYDSIEEEALSLKLSRCLHLEVTNYNPLIKPSSPIYLATIFFENISSKKVQNVHFKLILSKGADLDDLNFSKRVIIQSIGHYFDSVYANINLTKTEEISPWSIASLILNYCACL